MPDRIQQIFQRFLDFWNRYNRRQKTIVLSSLAAVILTLVILVAILSHPKYEHLTNCENYNEMSQITTILTENGYKYQTNESTMTILVRQQDLLNAKMLLATSNIETTDYTYQEYFSSIGISTTESDKLAMYQEAKKSELQSNLEAFDAIETAQVDLYIADTSNSLFQTKEGSSVSVILSLTREIGDEEAENFAYFIKNSVQNLQLKDITILSSTGESLYAGDAASSAGSYSALNKQLKYEQQLAGYAANDIKNAILSTGLYNDVKVIVKFDINHEQMERLLTEYSVPEGNEQGFFANSYLEKSTGGSTVGGVPGTDSNDEDDTTYDIQTSNGTTSTYSLEKNEYLVNVMNESTTTTPGDIITDSSTISVVLTKNVIYNEAEAQALGYLENTTWEEFKAANAEPVSIEFDEVWREIISNGTGGIPLDNISIAAYEKHFFFDRDRSTRPLSFYLQLVLALAILGLLAFVLLRSSRPIVVEETEPELSVEQMLATTKETQRVEDIDLQEKSEVRKAIEKFVDENPEAVALLLRNWLDDGWD